jgi:hypothetical protein
MFIAYRSPCTTVHSIENRIVFFIIIIDESKDWILDNIFVAVVDWISTKEQSLSGYKQLQNTK